MFWACEPIRQNDEIEGYVNQNTRTKEVITHFYDGSKFISNGNIPHVQTYNKGDRFDLQGIFSYLIKYYRQTVKKVQTDKDPIVKIEVIDSNGKLIGCSVGPYSNYSNQIEISFPLFLFLISFIEANENFLNKILLNSET